jgi:hypothetical protein
MQKQHFPSYVHHHDCVESRGRLRLQVLRSKHNDHRHEQRLRDETVAQSDDKEFEQILLGAQLQAKKLGRQQIVELRQNLQPSQLGDLGQGSARDALL